ncbi:MotB family protein [Atopomonas sediminilitoris]|uniref:MotB family protein n=1 Tax=Atopomonas sediminilitoris TaxID=2919919 RepID=UPI001F4F02C8|nr:MotB family protein [Atopomonas sediminilitoris]MCJ8170044.1 MotB family protein [Atopomonas sediminilitoris]
MEEPQDDPPAGAPLWLATFADLMSLLMCFFVLLLSFAEIDAKKFKQIAGSLQVAFGVQRDVYALDVPMGTSAIFDKFSPGKPEETPLEIVRQVTSPEDPNLETNTSQILKEKEQQETEEITKQIEQLTASLQEEVAQGRITIEQEPKRIIVRVEEKGSFQSGSSYVTDAFFDMLLRMADVLSEIEGTITIEGHSDNIPISTAMFQSNWDLSASRAAAVANVLLSSEKLEATQFRVSGFADTKPRVDNDTPENRALNRRVEIIIDKTNGEGHDESKQALGDAIPDDFRDSIDMQ